MVNLVFGFKLAFIRRCHIEIHFLARKKLVKNGYNISDRKFTYSYISYEMQIRFGNFLTSATWEDSSVKAILRVIFLPLLSPGLPISPFLGRSATST